MSTPELVGTLTGPVLFGTVVWRAGASGRDAGVGAGGFVTVGVGTLWLTMICSPAWRPKLESGSSGMRVNIFGGYPDLTGLKRSIERVGGAIWRRAHFPAEKGVSRRR